MTDAIRPTTNRLACALNFSNELSDSRLREMAVRHQKRWSGAKRAEKARLIQDNRPWLAATGPRSAGGKAISARNALKHGRYGALFNQIRALLRLQRRFIDGVAANIAVLRGDNAYKNGMELRDLIKQTRDVLSAAGVESPSLDADVLVRHYTGLDKADLIAHPDRGVAADVSAQIDAAAARRAGGEPVSRILGSREFWGMDFTVTPDTLDPRPETEILIECVLKSAPRDRDITILDLGTGTGCIPISLLCELPLARAVAVDISEGALAVARENAAAHGVADRISFLRGSWFDPLPPESRFDIITSNPPYIANPVIESLGREVRNHDPILALAGGEDGFDAYKAIITKIKTYLNPGGRALLEIGFGQVEGITRLVDDSNATLNSVTPDLAGIPRVVEIANGDK